MDNAATTLAAQQAMLDAVRRELRKKQIVTQLVGLTVTIAAGGVLFLLTHREEALCAATLGFLLMVACIVLFCILKAQHRKAMRTLADEASILSPAAPSPLPSAFPWYLLLASIACFGICMLSKMVGYTANSRRQSLNASAKSIYVAAQEYYQTQREDDSSFQLEPMIVNMAETPESGSQVAGIAKVLWENKGWYAIVCDEEGEIAYTLYSASPITDLTPMPKEEQIRLLGTLFSKGKAVGCHPEELT